MFIRSVPFFQPGLNNDFTPEMYIHDHTRSSIPRPVTSLQRCSTGNVCPPHRDNYLNNLLQVLVYGVLKEWSLMGGDRPFSPGQSNDLQPAFAIVPCVFLPASEDSQVTQSPIQHIHGPKALDPQRATESDRKD